MAKVTKKLFGRITVFQSFARVFVDERFINKAQFDVGFAHLLIMKDGAVPAIKDPDHD